MEPIAAEVDVKSAAAPHLGGSTPRVDEARRSDHSHQGHAGPRSEIGRIRRRFRPAIADRSGAAFTTRRTDPRPAAVPRSQRAAPGAGDAVVGIVPAHRRWSDPGVAALAAGPSRRCALVAARTDVGPVRHVAAGRTLGGVRRHPGRHRMDRPDRRQRPPRHRTAPQSDRRRSQPADRAVRGLDRRLPDRRRVE